MTAVTVREKDPDVDATYAIDCVERLVDLARRSFDFSLGAVVRAQRDTGWYYECTTAGRTSENYPAVFPRAAGETLQDGSVVWTCRHPSTPTLRSISSVVYTIPTGLTLESQTEDPTVAYFTVSGGVDGEDYDVVARITPSSGDPFDQTITIPVRAQ
jgi:hypothetical protein